MKLGVSCVLIIIFEIMEITGKICKMKIPLDFNVGSNIK
jgi:hypothetical protein